MSDSPVYVSALIPYRTSVDLAAYVKAYGVSLDAVVTAAIDNYLTAEFVRRRVEEQARERVQQS